jgi:protein-disulfide isomerase
VTAAAAVAEPPRHCHIGRDRIAQTRMCRFSRRSLSVLITRRQFVTATAALSAMLALPFGRDFAFVGDALAQTPSPADLMKAGPLGDVVVGKDDAPVTIIEYASMTCSHCATFHNTTYPAMKTKYIDTGKVKYILREFPLDPLAAAGFMLARCAGNDKYHAMVEMLFNKQKEWVTQNPIPPLLALAKQAGFTQESFESCLKDQKTLEAIESVRTHGAEKLGVNSTPTFFINGKLFRGTLTIDELDKQLEPLLKI